jgi:hypothetical protein
VRVRIPPPARRSYCTGAVCLAYRSGDRLWSSCRRMGTRPHSSYRRTYRADGCWEKGSSELGPGATAVTNASIARNAVAPVGVKRGPARSGVASRLLPLGRVEWSQELAYAVGLIATDGCLSGRAITFTNTGRQLVETFGQCVGHPVKIGVQFKPRRQPAYRAQLGQSDSVRAAHIDRHHTPEELDHRADRSAGRVLRGGRPRSSRRRWLRPELPVLSAQRDTSV